MTVIAITQDMGSLAKDIAVGLAATMDLTVLRKEVTDNVAGKMHVSRSLIKRLREGQAGFMERVKTDEKRVALFSAEEVFELANKGNVVIRGWGATCLLRPVPHVLCVRIIRSFAKRVEWLMTSLDTDDRELAETEIRRSDSAHASRMHEQFGVTWGDPLLYDIVLNTDRLSVDACVEQIRLLCNRPEFKQTPQSRQLLANMTLAARGRAALKLDESTKDIDITVEAENDKLILSGIVVNADEKMQVEKVATHVTGAVSVEIKLQVMAPIRNFTYSKT